MVDIPTVPITDAEDEDRFSVMRLDSLVEHHALLCEKLQDVAEGRIPNLMVLMPPGSAKSTYVDVVFVPWFMARYPRKNVGLGSYASAIARKQGRRARQIIKSRQFINLFPDASLSNESSAADEWALATGGEYMAFGLQSGVTGNRFGLGIIDDPVAGREEAESETIRNKTWEAYLDDFCSRLTPGAPQVMILTRWHQDDIAGRILPEDWSGESGWFEGRDGRTWYVLCVPAEAEKLDDPLGRKPGEYLWTEWFPESHWAPFKRNARSWTSLYQQRPAPAEGSFFQKAWLTAWDTKPARMRIYGTSDYAVTDEGGDYTVHRLWGVEPDGTLNRLGGWREQASSDKWIEAQIDLMAEHKPAAWFGEAGVIQKAIEPMLIRRMRERKVFCRLEWLPSIHDKPTRARGFQGRAAMGMVRFEPGADVSEFLSFPAGKHDDDVDCASLIGRALDEAHPAMLAVGNVPPPKRERYSGRKANPEGSWKVA
jgi:predicted phage terminase large subunit-like protein